MTETSAQTAHLPIPKYQTWAEYRRKFQWQGVQGQHQLEYPAIEGADFRGRLMALPVAQTCKRSDPGDTVLLGVEGDIEVTIGGTKLVLKPLDLLGIPANTPYSYANPGLENALICGVYADPDPSGPGRADAKPRHMIWEDYRGNFGWTQPRAERWGYHRGSGPFIIPPSLRGHTVRMPPGQSTPWHFTVRDLMFMCIHNEVEFAAAGRVWPLKRFDFLLIPAGVPYTYTNYGLEEVVFLSIGGKLPPGKKGTYFTRDPGWPIQADAPKMDVELDSAGDPRVKGQ